MIFRLFLIGLFCSIMISCGLAGPAYPNKNGAKYLQEKGYSKTIIEAVISISNLDVLEFERLAKEASTDVRFLIAQNPYISKNILIRMASDESDFVRGGAALNSNLSAELIEKLSSDPSHTTRLYVARNPHIPEHYLLDLYVNGKMELQWFAMNPKCPEILKQKMIDQNDEGALHWLEVTKKHSDWLESQRVNSAK